MIKKLIYYGTLWLTKEINLDSDDFGPKLKYANSIFLLNIVENPEKLLKEFYKTHLLDLCKFVQHPTMLSVIKS